MFDLDNFKEANDQYGHLFGDELLAEIAERLRNNMRSTDIAARMGGDEFILFMEYKNTVKPQIARIFKRLTGSYKDFSVGISMGIVTSENYTGDYDSLFKMADEAMYFVKKNKKNNYCFYNDIKDKK